MDFKNYAKHDRQTFEYYIKELMMGYDHQLTRKEIINLIYQHKTSSMSLKHCKVLSEKLYDDMYRLGLIQPLLDDEDISEIMINGLSPIIIEKNGKMICTDIAFKNETMLNNIIQKIVASVNRRVNASQPIVDARLEDGSRVNIVLKPVALNGPIVTIRKFKNELVNLDFYVTQGLMDESTKDFLVQCVKQKKNIFISGGTSSGKTTFLNALSYYIPPEERVITIEDSAELQLSHVHNLVTLETKEANYEGEGEISMDQLVIASLRMRPDRIIVGEIRGKEALHMIHAMNTGHDGSMSTGHSNSSMDMLHRLEWMVLSVMDIPLNAIKRMIGHSLDIVIHLERQLSGQRGILTIDQVFFEEDYVLKPLARLKEGILTQVGGVDEAKN